MRRSTSRSLLLGFALLTALAGCVLAPKGTDEERARLVAAAPAFRTPIAQRELPELPAQPGWRDVLERAFLANGDLEAAYYEWKAALARIDAAAAYPNTNVQLGFQYLFSGENLKGWDRTTLNVGFDPMQNLSFPSKVLAAGKVALEDARASGERFRAMKFELQRRVLDAYLDLAAANARLRLQRADLDLLRLGERSASARVNSGGMQRDLVEAQVQVAMAENMAVALQAEVVSARAMLNGLIGRASDAPLEVTKIPPPRPVAADDAILAAVAAGDPLLAEKDAEVAGRGHSLDLARQQYIPDINPFAGFRGGIEQVVGAAISVPMTIPKVRAGIREAAAMLQASEAARRQAELDRGASALSALAGVRAAEQQRAILEQTLMPAANRLAAVARATYGAGGVDVGDAIEAERMPIEVERLLIDARTGREKRLAELEELAGMDIETVGSSAHPCGGPPDSSTVPGECSARARGGPPGSCTVPGECSARPRGGPLSGAGTRPAATLDGREREAAQEIRVAFSHLDRDRRDDDD